MTKLTSRFNSFEEELAYYQGIATGKTQVMSMITAPAPKSEILKEAAVAQNIVVEDVPLAEKPIEFLTPMDEEVELETFNEELQEAINEFDETFNVTLAEANFGIVRLGSDDVEADWDTAIDAVDYPVHIVPAFYQHNDEYVEASGKTSGGRGKTFNMVVVDKLRNGQQEAIACVTGRYGSLNVANTYRDLKEQLNGVDYKLARLYVTENGGFQSLTLEFDLDALDGTADDLTMHIILNTSIDGTSSHTMSARAYSKTGGFSTAIMAGNGKLSARHTTTIENRTINFVPTVCNLLENWNDIIAPTMALLCDTKYDASLANELLDRIAEDSGVSEPHREKIGMLYNSSSVRTNEQGHSLYRIQATIAQYVNDEMEEKPELQNRILNGLDKKIRKMCKK